MMPRVLGSAKSFLYSKLKLLSDEMRNHPTKAESILWRGLNRKQLGYKFRRQHIVDQFIVDFYCIEAQLVIEVDGEIHLQTVDRDSQRDETLKNLGLSTIRFTNDEVINHTDSVLLKIRFVLETIFKATDESPRMKPPIPLKGE